MKFLTVVVPCYNSQDYMEKCVDSLLKEKESIEILIINDGSTDNTEKIAKKYEQDYPETVRLISQENKGHGGAINTGLKNASCKYFKVVDSDDYLEETALHTVISSLKKLEENNEEVDMYLSNYVYDKKGKKIKKVMRYLSLPQGRIFTWDEFKLKRFTYILMHSIIYKTQLLRDCNLTLPEKISYDDNLYAFQPLLYVKKMYYDNVDLYMYFIGREGQSVNEKTMVKRRSHYQLLTNKIIDLFFEYEIDHENKKQYLIQYLDIMMFLSTLVLILSGTKEDFEDKDKIWKKLRDKDRKIYKKIRRTPLGIISRTRKINRYNVITIYKIAQKIYGFN